MWSDTFNDQEFLHQVLGSNPDILAACLVDDGDLINYEGRFMRQVLRSRFATMRERMAWVTAENRRILGPEEGTQMKSQLPPEHRIFESLDKEPGSRGETIRALDPIPTTLLNIESF